MGKPGRPKKNPETPQQTEEVAEHQAPVTPEVAAVLAAPEVTLEVIVPPPPPAKASTGDKTVKVRAQLPFCDGDLMEAFKALGYAVEWPAGQYRTITLRLLKRCLSSGGVFETEDGRELAADG